MMLGARSRRFEENSILDVSADQKTSRSFVKDYSRWPLGLDVTFGVPWNAPDASHGSKVPITHKFTVNIKTKIHITDLCSPCMSRKTALIQNPGPSQLLHIKT